MAKAKLARDILTFERFVETGGRYKSTAQRCFAGVRNYLKRHEDPNRPLSIKRFTKKVDRREFLKLENFGKFELELLMRVLRRLHEEGIV